MLLLSNFFVLCCPKSDVGWCEIFIFRETRDYYVFIVKILNEGPKSHITRRSYGYISSYHTFVGEGGEKSNFYMGGKGIEKTRLFMYKYSTT